MAEIRVNPTRMELLRLNAVLRPHGADTSC